MDIDIPFVPLSREEEPEYISLEMDKPQVPPASPKVAQTRAIKYDTALGENSPGYDRLFSSILSGTEDYERDQAALRLNFRDDQERQQLLQESLASGDTDTVFALAGARSLEMNRPDAVMEDQWSSWLVNNHQSTNYKLAAQENPEAASRLLDATQYVLFQKEMGQRWLEDLESKWEAQGLGGKAWNYAETFVPFWSWSNISGAAEGIPTSSMLSGSNAREQYQGLLSLPKDQFVTEAKAAIDKLAESNLLDAMQFASGLVSYSTSDEWFANSIDVIEAGTLVTPAQGARIVTRTAGATKAAVSRTSELAGSLKDMVKANSGRSVSMPAIKTAAGDANGAALDIAISKIKRKVNAVDAAGQTVGGVSSTFDDLAGEIHPIFNPKFALGIDKDTGSLTAESVQRILTQFETNGATLLNNIVDPLRPGVLTDEQLLKGAQVAEEVFKKQYPHLNDVVMRVLPMARPDVLSDADMVAVHLGNQHAQPFKSKQQAHNVAKNFYKLRDNYVVRQYGNDQHFIEVVQPIDATSTAVRDVPVVGTKWETPKGFWNTFLGPVRTPEDLLSSKTMENIKLGPVGSSAYMKRIREVAAPMSKVKDKEAFVRFLEAQRDFVHPKTGEIGRFSGTLGEFERDWLAFHNRLPTETEHLAYQTYKQLNDFDYLVYNLDLLGGKYRNGIQDFQFPWIDPAVVTDNPKAVMTDRIEGKYLADGLPWEKGDTEPFQFVILDKDVTKPFRSYNSRFTNRERLTEELGGQNYHVIQLSSEGEKALREMPGFRKAVPEGKIHYVLTQDYETKPLQWKQIPYRAGGRIEHQQGWYAAQPRIRAIGDPDGKVRHAYDGDINILQVLAETDGHRQVAALEQARKLFKESITEPGETGRPRLFARSELIKFLENNLPWTFDEFEKLWAGFGGELDPNIPIRLRRSDSSLGDTYELGREYANLFDSRKSSHNLYNNIDLRYALERGSPISRIAREGDTNNPLFKLRPARLIDPLTTLNRSTAHLMRNRYLEGVKFQLAEQFINEFGSVLKASTEELRQNPLQHLINPTWVTNPVNRDQLAAAKNFRRSAVNFLGLKSDFQKDVRYFKQKLADLVFERFGEKGFTIVEPYLLGQTRDPVKFFRSVAFHTHLGLFNPVQMFLQAQTITHIAGIEGLKSAYEGMAASVLMRRLVFNNSPEILDAAAKRAAKFGWNEADFKESYEAMKRTGWYNVGGEVAVRDDFFDGNVIESMGAKFLEKGTMFFNEGERIARLVAWNAAYKRWKGANPGKAPGNEDIKAILSRADLLTVNMTAASNAAWGKGFASVPTQFFNYQARLAEQFLGKRLTSSEKARALLTYSAIYGLPVAAGAPFAIYPFYQDIRQSLLERGIEYDNNIVSQTLVDGLVTMGLEWATGEKFNFGGRYGPGGLSVAKDLIEGEKGVVETLLGVSGSSMKNIIYSFEPFTMSVVDTISGKQDSWPLVLGDFTDMLAGSINTMKQLKRMLVATSIGQYISRNEMVIDEVSGLEGVFMGISGLTPQRIEDLWLKMDSNKALRELQIEYRREAIAAYRKALRAQSDTERAAFLRRAKVYIESGHFTDSQKSNILSDAVKGETLLQKVNEDFSKYTPERKKAWIKELQSRERVTE